MRFWGQVSFFMFFNYVFYLNNVIFILFICWYNLFIFCLLFFDEYLIYINQYWNVYKKLIKLINFKVSNLKYFNCSVKGRYDVDKE